LNGAVLGMRKAEIDRKFEEIVAFAEIERFIDTPVKHYSSGMHMRLAFAVAAHLDPEIMIVDEVLAVGDQRFQNKCMGKMGEIGTSGRTIIFVSHNMTAVQGLCSRAIWLSEGELREEGGYRADRLTFLARFFPSAAYLDETAYCFVGEELVADPLASDDDEFFERRVVPFRDAVAMALDDRITESLSKLALLAAALRRGLAL